MKRDHFLKAMATDLEILVEKSPITARLRDLAERMDFYLTANRTPRQKLRECLKSRQVLAATDPWSDLKYQSLYLTEEGTPEDRLVLQEPAVEDPSVGIMVLKAARLSGRSGMVYCGTEEQLKSFANKLAEYEKRGIDLDEAEMLECLMEAAQAEGLRVIFHRLSEEHGGESEDLED